MKQMRVEVCIISARGLKRPSSLWKLQWFAVGWIDPNNKYCTKIDASGSKNPTWKTKFSALIDGTSDDSKSPTLQVQVYSRDPIFLREKLQGTATILLKEFLDKYYDSVNNNSASSGFMEEEVGSFQLRKKSSGKPQGFVDVSIRISEEREGGGGGSFSNYYSGNNEEGFELGGGSGSAGRSNEIFIGEDGRSNVDDYHHPHPPPPPRRHHHPHQPSDHSHSGQRPPAPSHWRQPESTPHPVAHSMMPQPNVDDYHHPHPHPPHPRRRHHHQPSDHSPSEQRPPSPPHWRQPESTPHPVAHSMTPQPNNSNSNLQPISISQGTPSSYRPPPPPPPPPSHVGFLPTFLPRTDQHYSGTYVNNVGSSGWTAPVRHGAGGARNNNGFGMGMSAGALAAGAVLFGDDFMSGFDIPGSLQDSPLPISTHPPF